MEAKKSQAEYSFLQWTKESPVESGQDPLGLNLRISARLGSDLLYCITSISPRARYYVFYPWAIGHYLQYEKNSPADRGLRHGLLHRERALTLGSVLFHDGKACEGGSLGGSDAARSGLGSLGRAVDLQKLQFLKNPWGQYGAAYRGPLSGLGVFEALESPDINDEVISDEEAEGSEVDDARLSPLGERLANAFNQIVARTEFVRSFASDRRAVPREVLEEFGRSGHLCGLADSDGDLAVLRELFFSDEASSTRTSHFRRRMSLLLFLQAIKALGERDVACNAWSFGWAVYYGRAIRLGARGDSVFDVRWPPALADIAARWRCFYFHFYLTVALESLLVRLVAMARTNRGGIKPEAMIDGLASGYVTRELNKLVSLRLDRPFSNLSPAELLPSDGNLPGISSPLSEKSLADVLLGQDGKAQEEAGPALAALLLFVLLARYPRVVNKNYENWMVTKVRDSYRDVTVPGFLRYLTSTLGHSWWREPIGTILKAIVRRFVVSLHEAMIYERGGYTTALLRHDGEKVLWAGYDFPSSTAGNPRFPSALQILIDLGLAAPASSDPAVLKLTPAGRGRLARGLEARLHP